jgi:hypothetical protein
MKKMLVVSTAVTVALVVVILTCGASCNSGAACERSFAGFQQYWKCPGMGVVSLGDTGSEDACLSACEAQPEALGCWYLNGTGGFPRDCRICVDTPPIKETFANDFAGALSPCPGP